MSEYLLEVKDLKKYFDTPKGKLHAVDGVSFTIEKGRRCQCMYATPYGTLSMGFFGESIENRLTENGGEIKLTYTVDVNNSQMNKNEMTICIKDVQF